MGHYDLDPARDHAEQAGGLLATAIELGYGTLAVNWDPASGRYEAPDDVIEAFVQHQKDAHAEQDDESGDDEGEETGSESDSGQKPARRRGGRKAAPKPAAEGDAANADAGKE